MKESAKIGWFVILLLVSGFGLGQLKGLAVLSYDQFRSKNWPTTEGIVRDNTHSPAVSVSYTGHAGRTSSTSWVSDARIPIDYTWKGDEAIQFISADFMIDSGDLVDVAYSQNENPEIVVRYRNFNQRIAWKTLWSLILLAGPFYIFKTISKKTT